MDRRRRGKDRRIVRPTTLSSKRCFWYARGSICAAGRKVRDLGTGDKICGVVRSSLRRATGRNFIYTYSASLPLNTAFRFTSYLALTSRFASPPCHRVPLFAALVVLPRFVPFRRASSTIFFRSPLHLLDPIGIEPRPTRLDRDASDRSLSFSLSLRSAPTKESPDALHPESFSSLYRAKAPPL